MISWRYDGTDSYTRVQSQPWTGEPQELNHYDPDTKDCDDAHNSGTPISPVPCVYIYDAGVCEGGGATAHATIVAGVITAITVDSGGTYTGTPTVVITSPDGTGATATATVGGGAVTSVAVGAGGTGYKSAIISFKGGGSGLQKAQYLLCIEDGRLVQRFVAYVTVG